MQIMGILESKPASPQNSSVSTEAVSADGREEKFKEEVRKSADNFKNLVMRNKVMIFSATYCSYCTVAKVGPALSIHLRCFTNLPICPEHPGGPRDSVPELRGEQVRVGGQHDDGHRRGRDGQQDGSSDLHMRPAGAGGRIRPQTSGLHRAADGDSEQVL